MKPIEMLTDKSDKEKEPEVVEQEDVKQPKKVDNNTLLWIGVLVVVIMIAYYLYTRSQIEEPEYYED